MTPMIAMQAVNVASVLDRVVFSEPDEPRRFNVGHEAGHDGRDGNVVEAEHGVHG